jgi:cell division protein FtsB
MKLVITVLIVLLAGLQYQLWVGEGSLAHRFQLQQQVDQQRTGNELLQERNRVIALEVEELKSGHESVEERAREQMGMIKQGETFFMVVGLEPSAMIAEPLETIKKPLVTAVDNSPKNMGRQ